MKTKKHLFIFIFLCTTCFTITAQKNNYKNGYIITNERDTLFGWIDLRIDEINNKECRFTRDINQKEQVYHPDEIAGYRFSDEGKYYVSRDIVLNSIRKKVFLEYLVQGIMDLYYYSDGKQDYFFFENQEGEMDVVTRKPDRIKSAKIIPDNKYKGLVAYIFSDYQPIVNEAEKIQFNQQSFINIAKKYHEAVCTTGEDCIVFENQHPDAVPLKFTLSAYTGANIFTYAFQYDYVYQVKATDASPMMGFGVNLKNPRWSQSWSTQFDIFASKHSDEIRYADEFYNHVLAYESNLLFFNLGIKYEYPKYEFHPVAEAGFSYAKFFNAKDNYGLATNAQGFYFGLGFDYKLNQKQTILFRVNVANGFATSSSYGRNINYTNIKLGYAHTF
jgi:hypothetical protein